MVVVVEMLLQYISLMQLHFSHCNEIDFEVHEARSVMGLKVHQDVVKKANSLE